MFQGMGPRAEQLNRNWGFEPADVDMLILSHAHIDHSGLIPRLVKAGFKGPIFCTAPTRKLTELLLMDSARIQEEEQDFARRKLNRLHPPSLKLNRFTPRPMYPPACSCSGKSLTTGGRPSPMV